MFEKNNIKSFNDFVAEAKKNIKSDDLLEQLHHCDENCSNIHNTKEKLMKIMDKKVDEFLNRLTTDEIIRVLKTRIVLSNETKRCLNLKIEKFKDDKSKVKISVVNSDEVKKYINNLDPYITFEPLQFKKELNLEIETEIEY